MIDGADYVLVSGVNWKASSIFRAIGLQALYHQAQFSVLLRTIIDFSISFVIFCEMWEDYKGKLVKRAKEERRELIYLPDRQATVL